MKIARFNGGRIGVVRGDEIIDVTELAGVDANAWPPVGMNALIANFAGVRAKLDAARAPALKLSAVRLDTPVPWPNKVIAFPANYHDHAAEMGATIRANSQGWFLKPSSSVSGPRDPVELPALPWRRIDHEAELGIIIGKVGRNIEKGSWRDYIFGFTCLLDMVVRGKEERVMRKGYDSFCPVGPWIVTADEVGDPTSLDMKLWVNNEIRQSCNTRDLIVDIPGMIEMSAAVATIYPGDIIASGTPAGVGPVKGGDKVRIWIDRVAEMSVDVVQGTRGYTDALCEKPDMKS